MAIDPRSKGISLDDAALTLKEHLHYQYAKMKDPIAEAASDICELDGSFMEAVFSGQSTTNHNEVDQYFTMQSIGLMENPLTWWASRQTTLPRLAMLAKKFLAIPATSVSCERLFSASGNIMNKKRTRLAPATLSKIVFCHANRKRYGSMFPDISDVVPEIDSDEESHEESDEDFISD
jgi:hypothetical protein